MNWIPDALADTEGDNEQYCEECHCTSVVLIKVTVRRNTREVNRVEKVEELWCQDCIQDQV